LNLLAITCLFITVTAIQFWMTDYMIQVHEVSQNTAFKSFAVVSLLAPVSGVICGGYIFDRCGGYNSYKALHVLQFVGLGAWTTGFMAAAANTYPGFVFFIVLQLFFGGMVMPPATGILLNQVPQNMRTVANSVANMTYNLLGYVPAPYIYGYVYQQAGQGKSHSGFFAVEFFGFMSFVFSLAFYIRKRLAFRAYLREQQTKIGYSTAMSTPPSNDGSNKESDEQSNSE
jgi:MFS family permease